MEISLSGLAPKIQGNVDQWNLRWRSIEAEAEKIETMRKAILDEIETGSAGDLVSKAGALEGRTIAIHQKKLAALRERAEILSNAEPAQREAITDLEAATQKAEKGAEAALKKAGISAEQDPHFNDFPEAAHHRVRVRVLECEGVRQAHAALNDGKNQLELIIEARRADRQILQSGIDELNTVARKLLRM